MLRTRDLKKQYKIIPSQTKEYDGSGGVIIAGLQEKFKPYRLIIDENATNTLVIGVAGSGKTEMFTFPMIDVLSRAKDKPNLIIHDRGTLGNASYKTLKERGYDVYVIDFSQEVIDVKWGDSPIAIFMVSNIFNQQSLNRISDFISINGFGLNNGRETHFLLDDFISIPTITGISEILQRSIQCKTHFHFIIQSYNQLESLYGVETNRILDSCSNQIYLTSFEEQTIKQLNCSLGSKLSEEVDLNMLNLGESIIFCKNRKLILSKGATARKLRWEYLIDDFCLGSEVHEPREIRWNN